MPAWLIAVFIVIGVIGGFVCLIFLIRTVNKKKKFKFKVPSAKQTEQPRPEPQENLQGETYDEDEFANVNFDEPSPEEEAGPQVEPFNPFDFDDDFIEEDERRYRDFMHGRGRPRPQKRELTPDEEFEKFRREHCYSKFVTDSELAAALKNAPKEVRDIILNDLLKSLNLNNYNDIKF